MKAKITHITSNGLGNDPESTQPATELEALQNRRAVLVNNLDWLTGDELTHAQNVLGALDEQIDRLTTPVMPPAGICPECGRRLGEDAPLEQVCPACAADWQAAYATAMMDGTDLSRERATRWAQDRWLEEVEARRRRAERAAPMVAVVWPSGNVPGVDW